MVTNIAITYPGRACEPCERHYESGRGPGLMSDFIHFKGAATHRQILDRSHNIRMYFDVERRIHRCIHTSE